MKKEKPNYGYYCDICGCKICKYLADFKACGGLSIEVDIKDKSSKVIDVCSDCGKAIFEEVLEAHGL